MQHGMMFDFGRNNMLSFGRKRFCTAFDRPVVALTAAGRKIYLLWLCSNQIRDRLPGFFHRLFTLLRKGIDTVRIAVIF